ncbi:MAG: peptidylprolyl isomerase [Deltaproteobacteria bacterium RIFCSPLOWO2_12_FULL_40_28]|nr:MAG: peptidylprolyl isomerase [Deltaproteobacteria bacterium RIFCSPHIGHO2_02_FULL_40_28]OGQ20329.1 MAG: peptidylprolyl isomerase [Deltaproteobacteria bacterium RIFCSPHIGHO2_12_FULL_40_32]OGQ40786.1 MAG: peptidylprolyl isomerase [Deltaproteobacteria bacterium RIFCSPLOWO2_02_FULL_40_36]OGQ54936.1 MAG: peptidylprolyl isomerase [Deltaproteobacteria bacterium RIFCSPLOWO2_12_FULL_40_28]
MKNLTFALLFSILCISSFQVYSAGTPMTTPSGLKYTDQLMGTGIEALAGKTAVVHYTGWLSQGGKKGKQFDSSLERAEPFEFLIGVGRVIKGWDEGILGMKAGGKRQLIIPATLAYGPMGAPPTIPPNAELIFDIQLLDVK